MLKQIERIERLHQLIRIKATGNPKTCAERIKISERQLYNTLELMKELGAPIYFDFAAGSYCYEEEVHCSFRFYKKLTNEQMGKIKGNGLFAENVFPLQFYFSDQTYTCYQEAHTIF